jgi:hypothetical protein
MIIKTRVAAAMPEDCFGGARRLGIQVRNVMCRRAHGKSACARDDADRFPSDEMRSTGVRSLIIHVLLQ